MKTLNKKEKAIWNKAVEKTCNELRKWDGIIEDDIDILRLIFMLKKKLYYTLKTNLPK